MQVFPDPGDLDSEPDTLREVGRFTKTHSVSAGAQAQRLPPAMHCLRLALGLGFCLLLGITLCSLW